MTAITAPGIYTGFDIEAYHADPCPTPSLTQSIAKILIERSPAHAAAEHSRLRLAGEAEEEGPEKYDAAKAIGDAFHALMIGRGKLLEIGDYPNWMTKEAKAFKAHALEIGGVPILAKHHERAQAMANAAQDQIEAAGWPEAFHRDNGRGEVVIAWQEDGLWFRSLIDWMPTNGSAALYDLKSTGLSVAPHAIPNLMANAGWDVQAAFHERGLAVLNPELAGHRKFRFIAIENEPPYALTPVELSEGVMTMGRKKVDYAVALWRRCMEADEWPAYPLDVCRPEYPGWKESQWLAREIDAAGKDRLPKRGMIPSLMGG